MQVELIVITVLAGLLASAVVAWIWSGIRSAGKGIDRIVHLAGQPEPCLAGNGQSIGQWVYCDLEEGHDGPHEGWSAALAPEEAGVRYWNRPMMAVRTKWTDFEPAPFRADRTTGEESA